MRHVAERFECSLHTANRALKTLVAEGLLHARQGSGIVVADPTPAPQAIVVVPSWSTADELYGARMLYAASDALGQLNWSVQTQAGFSLANFSRSLQGLSSQSSSPSKAHPKRQILYALAANLPENHHQELDRTRQHWQEQHKAELRLVSTHRRHPQWQCPAVVDDFEDGFRQLLVQLQQRGVRRLVVIARKSGDNTYEDALQILLELLPSSELTLAEGELYRDQGLNVDVLRSFSTPPQLDASSCVLSFTPNALRELQHWFSGLPQPPLLGCLSIRSITPFPKVDFVLESRLNEHARCAARLLQQWHDSGRAPDHQKIPMDLIWNT